MTTGAALSLLIHVKPRKPLKPKRLWPSGLLCPWRGYPRLETFLGFSQIVARFQQARCPFLLLGKDLVASGQRTSAHWYPFKSAYCSMSDQVLVVGATSGIAKALCHRLAQRGDRLLLAGRDAEELKRMAADLSVRYGTEVATEVFEATDLQSHPDFVRRCFERFEGNLTGAILCHGVLPDQKETETNVAVALRTVEINFTSYVSLLHLLALELEKKGLGYLAVISSVAGDRGRRSNYTYGATKGGLTVFLQGLRNRLYHHGVHVLTIQPGPVDTPMISGMFKPGSPLVASPERVARSIQHAIDRRSNVIYTPWFWRPMMTIICAMPEWLFKRLNL